jgi:hydroxymethylglutaryl-CoA reductase (NADPH)
VELRRWPRKNDPDSVRTRQAALRSLTDDGEAFWDDLTPWASAQEAVTGVAVIPVSVIGPLDVSLGEYELEEPWGRLAEVERRQEQVFVPLAHTEGGLSASLYRGARAASESGGFRTYVLKDRMTRASCFICKNAEEAV